MRVLHVISSGGLYGAEAVILQLSGLVNRDAAEASQVAVFAHAGQPPPALHGAAAAAGVPVHPVSCRGQLDLTVGGRLRGLAREVGADIVHAHGYKADIYAYAAFGAFRGNERPALVSTCHTWYDNDWAVRLYGAADRWVLRSFDEVVAVSAEVRARLLQAGVAADRLHVVRNGIMAAPREELSEDLFEDLPQRAEDSSLRVGVVGRLAPEKGIDLFLEAAAEVSQRFPAARFVVAGDGPDRASLEDLLPQLGLQAKAELLGQQADMPAFYRSLDLLVSASRQEGLPMALLEGMGAGLAVVATAVGEVPQVVVSGQTGLVVPPNSPGRLAEAMSLLLSDAALRRRFGEAGRRRVAEEFSAEQMTAAYLGVYRQALAKRATLPPGLRRNGGAR